MMSENAPLRVILTGATGMVGEGVLNECLSHSLVGSVLVMGRKTCGIHHPKLKELLHNDFFNVESLREELTGYNACFFCLGVSSFRMDEKTYRPLTLDLTLHFAKTLAEINPSMAFCYVSGSGTDSTEAGKIMWARIKGKTENELLKLPFQKAYMFRPGYLHPSKGLNNTHFYYRLLGFLYPVLKRVFPRYVNSLEELGKAMIQVSSGGYPKNLIECEDIGRLAAQSQPF